MQPSCHGDSLVDSRAKSGSAVLDGDVEASAEIAEGVDHRYDGFATVPFFVAQPRARPHSRREAETFGVSDEGAHVLEEIPAELHSVMCGVRT